MSAKHTAGPWSYGEGTRAFNIRALLGGVATVKKNLYSENNRTEADARLIAAAPSMLETLQALDAAYESTLPTSELPPVVEGEHDPYRYRRLVHLTIRQATGAME